MCRCCSWRVVSNTPPWSQQTGNSSRLAAAIRGVWVKGRPPIRWCRRGSRHSKDTTSARQVFVLTKDASLCSGPIITYTAVLMCFHSNSSFTGCYLTVRSLLCVCAQVSCGINHTLALSSDGMTLWAFGDGDYGKLGTGPCTVKCYPQVLLIMSSSHPGAFLLINRITIAQFQVQDDLSHAC